jgi:hypothetical protein
VSESGIEAMNLKKSGFGKKTCLRLKMFSSIVVLVVVQMPRLFGAMQSIGRRVQ